MNENRKIPEDRKKGEGKSDLLLVELLVRNPGLTEEEARRELNFPRSRSQDRGKRVPGSSAHTGVLFPGAF